MEIALCFNICGVKKMSERSVISIGCSARFETFFSPKHQVVFYLTHVYDKIGTLIFREVLTK